MIEHERLLVEAAQQDLRRFAELYEANFERVYAFIVRRVHDRTQAEDLTSEVFRHALENLSRFEWRGVPFAAWLYRVAIPMQQPWTISTGRTGRRSSGERLCTNLSAAFLKINGG